MNFYTKTVHRCSLLMKYVYFYFNNKLGKTKFHKSQLFDYKNDVRCFVGGAKSGIGMFWLPNLSYKPTTLVSMLYKSVHPHYVNAHYGFCHLKQ